MRNVCLGPTFVYNRMTSRDKVAYKSMELHNPHNVAQLKKQRETTTQQVFFWSLIHSTPTQQQQSHLTN